MIAFLILFLHVLVSPFKTRARLEAEIIMLRHQLNVLRRRVHSKPRLTVADRLIFVWLYGLFPSLFNAPPRRPAQPLAAEQVTLQAVRCLGASAARVETQ